LFESDGQKSLGRVRMIVPVREGVMRETTMLPVRTVEGPEGIRAPFYVLPFDKGGTCVAPVSRDLLARAALDSTDVFVFSHGWNNDFVTATSYYDAFIARYIKLREQAWGTPGREYRPLLAGVFWPSTALTAPSDAEGDRAMLAELAGGFTRTERAAARELADREWLDLDDAHRLAELLHALLRSEDDEPRDGPGAPLDLVKAIQANTAANSGGDRIDPRALIRMATLLLMKDRAAAVGSHGVADLLLRLQATPAPNLAEHRRIHLVGHSYGAKVMLAALSSAACGSLLVDSVLLLQPAVSAWCFAPDGAYRTAPRRVRQPLVTTFSANDEPLNQFPEKDFTALGGVGPRGLDAAVVEPVDPPTPNAFPADAPNHLVAVRADSVIAGHADVFSDATAWMLLNQVQG
jgi:hypothetical protein